MAIEKLNRAAREAQPKVISMAAAIECGGTVPRLNPPLMPPLLMLTATEARGGVPTIASCAPIAGLTSPRLVLSIAICHAPQPSRPDRPGSAVAWLLSSATSTSSSPATTLERQGLRAPYPNCRVVVLDDDVNTFQHVVECLVRYIPAMTPDQAWELAHRIDGEGSAVVWCGPQEQAELYHQQLGAEGLTMAPLERA